MPETKQLLRETRDRIAPPIDVLDGLERRRRHNQNMKRAEAAVVGIVVAIIGLGGWLLLDRSESPTPADRSYELGIFAPVAGRIVYENADEVGDPGYGPGLWGIDPDGPSDTAAGPTVADDVASTLVPLGPEDAIPLEWSSDGTELLIVRTDPAACEICASAYLSVLHADGSETRLNEEPVHFGGADLSPDGERVVFAADGLYVVDADGGRPVRLPVGGSSPTFSPDGSQIAYLFYGNDVAGSVEEEHVWVANEHGRHRRARDPRGRADRLAGRVGPSVVTGGRPYRARGRRTRRERSPRDLHLRPRRLGLHAGNHRRDLAVLVTRRIADRVHDPLRPRVLRWLVPGGLHQPLAVRRSA
jgi:hypothetical protein